MHTLLLCQECTLRKFVSITDGDLWDYGKGRRLQQYMSGDYTCRLCALLNCSFKLREAIQEKGDDILDWNVWLRLSSKELLAILVHPGQASQAIQRRHESRGSIPVFRDIYSLILELEDTELCISESYKILPGNVKAPLKAATFPMYNHSGDKECLELIKKWLFDCTQRHQKTCPLSFKVNLPKRVLDVNNDRGYVRLVETADKDVPVSGQYAALSYRWGKPRVPEEQFLVTDPGSLERHKKGIPIKHCPQTIQDAIRTTRGLHLRYLWVDSLCILQGKDNPIAQKDFSEQCLLMGDIYRKAFVTIIAANTLCADDGFLKSRKNIEENWITFENSNSNSFRRGHHKPTKWTICDWDFPKNIYTWPTTVDERAWCLQEKLLSGRILSYHNEGVILACRAGNYTEVKGFSRWRTNRTLDWPTVDNSWKKHLFTGSSLLFPDQVLSTGVVSKKKYENHLWTNIISEYSRRSIEVATDRIPAIAGIAKFWQQVFEDKYCAGMWDRHLHRQLLWSHWGRPSGENRQLLLAKQARVPSWSWLNVQGEVDFHIGLCGDSSSLSGESWSVDVKKESFAAVTCMVLGSESESLAGDAMIYLFLRGRKIDLSDLPPQPVLEPNLPNRLRGLTFEKPEWRGIHLDAGNKDEQSKKLCFIEIVRFKWRELPSDNYHYLSSGLILQETGNKASKVYKEQGTVHHLESEESKSFKIKPEHQSLPRYKRIGALWGVSEGDIELSGRVKTNEIVIV